ncbi:hypothetical protein RF11_13538 [Thelohanellus kitauei]|uniref:Winged helix-turn helix domain-containing protein n=1 Tax=Thelohanellus kitauei TaxID=669202 RepID=A0A0C2M693_THEKT|nr:hypothetical protein RF11_13538 [Thelohanellus kitauei]
MLRGTGRILDIPATTVRYILPSNEQNGSTEIRPIGSSIQTKPTEEVTNRSINLIMDDDLYTLPDIQHHLELDIHRAKIWNWLKNINFSCKTTRHIPEGMNDGHV